MTERDVIDRDFWYVLLSMVSKTTLHLFVGLLVIGQGSTLAVDADAQERTSDMETLQIGLSAGAGIAIFLGVSLYFFVPADDFITDAVYGPRKNARVSKPL
jgi:hypothetical protein